MRPTLCTTRRRFAHASGMPGTLRGQISETDSPGCPYRETCAAPAPALRLSPGQDYFAADALLEGYGADCALPVAGWQMASSESAGRWPVSHSLWKGTRGESSGCAEARPKNLRCPASRAAAQAGFAANLRPCALRMTNGNQLLPMNERLPPVQLARRQAPQHAPVFSPVFHLTDRTSSSADATAGFALSTSPSTSSRRSVPQKERVSISPASGCPVLPRLRRRVERLQRRRKSVPLGRSPRIRNARLRATGLSSRRVREPQSRPLLLVVPSIGSQRPCRASV